MGLLKSAADSIKDTNSLLRNKFSRRTPHRNPKLEAAIISATSHRELYFDYNQAKIVFSWIRSSPPSFSPLITPLCNRIEKTRSWAVAVKCLMLVHGVLHCIKPTTTKQFGRLHFDLSSFSDGHSPPAKIWGFDLFVHQYFAFLDQWLVYVLKNSGAKSLAQEMLDLQKRQNLLGLLLQIRPRSANMRVGLILDAMDCVLAEAQQIQTLISRGIADLASKVARSKSMPEVAMAVQILRKAAAQGEELSTYLQHCQNFGIVNANEIEVSKIPKEDTRELERIIHGGSVESKVMIRTLITEE